MLSDFNFIMILFYCGFSITKEQLMNAFQFHYDLILFTTPK